MNSGGGILTYSQHFDSADLSALRISTVNDQVPVSRRFTHPEILLDPERYLTDAEGAK